MTNDDPRPPSQHTIGGFDGAGRLWVLALFALGGMALGALLPLMAGWAADLAWVPFQGPLRLLGSFDQPWLVWGRPMLGLVAGLGLALWVILDSPVLVIDHDRILVRRRGQAERVLERSKIDSIYRSGSKTVIETESGRKLFEDEIEGDRSQIRTAFIDNGYPWEGAPD